MVARVLLPLVAASLAIRQSLPTIIITTTTTAHPRILTVRLMWPIQSVHSAIFYNTMWCDVMVRSDPKLQMVGPIATILHFVRLVRVVVIAVVVVHCYCQHVTVNIQLLGHATTYSDTKFDTVQVIYLTDLICYKLSITFATIVENCRISYH